MRVPGVTTRTCVYLSVWSRPCLGVQMLLFMGAKFPNEGKCSTRILLWWPVLRLGVDYYDTFSALPSSPVLRRKDEVDGHVLEFPRLNSLP